MFRCIASRIQSPVKKNSTTCRFNFPRPPIRETFLVKVKDDDAENKVEETVQTKGMPTLEEIEQLCKSGAQRSPKQIVKNLRNVINSNESEQLTLEDILRTCNVTYAQYKDSLAAITKKNTIYHKRDIDDGWVNNYNPTLLRAWNANMDIQYVMDPYSCVAYILSYISKAEAEVGELIASTNKSTRGQQRCRFCYKTNIPGLYLKQRSICTRTRLQSLLLALERMLETSRFPSCWKQFNQNEPSAERTEVPKR